MTKWLWFVFGKDKKKKKNSLAAAVDTEVPSEVPTHRNVVSLPNRIGLEGMEAFLPVIDDDEEEECSDMHVPSIDLMRQTSESIRQIWNKPRPRGEWIVEYNDIFENIVLESQWVRHTKQERYLRMIKNAFQAQRGLEERMRSFSEFREVLSALIKKAYPRSYSPRLVQDIVHGCNIFDVISQFYNNLGWRQPYCTYALKLFAANENADTILAKLTEICDRAPRCSSAQRQAFNLIIRSACRDRREGKEDGKGPANTEEGTLDDLSTKQGALLRFYECIEDYLDDHKERAFKSAFMEPARYYYNLVGNHFMRDHVNVHGLNWYLALLHAVLGLQLPLLPELSDRDIMGVTPFWEGLHDRAWEIFSDPQYFGMDYEGIKALRSGDAARVRRHVADGELPLGNRAAHPKILGNQAVDPNHHNANLRSQLAKYVGRYAYFLSKDFFVKKAFEVLNSELKPEHAGFRKAAQTLYEIYRQECLLPSLSGAGTAATTPPETYLEYAYKDDYYTELDVDNVNRFLAWLYITKGDVIEAEASVVSHDEVIPSMLPPEQTKVEMQQCPICMEIKDDVTVLIHSPGTVGDISSHKMCGDCCVHYHKFECPFCKQEIQGNPLPRFIHDYISMLQHIDYNDPNALASIFEDWQLFELGGISDGAQMTVKAAVKILNDEFFHSRMSTGVRHHEGWLRDAAGTFFRFYGMYRGGEIVLDPAHGELLNGVISVILQPFEAETPVQLHGHFYGALYQQALSAWLCAFSTNMSTTALGELIQRCGRALVRFLNTHRHSRRAFHETRNHMKERIIRDQAESARDAVWHGNDVVWQALYGNV